MLVYLSYLSAWCQWCLHCGCWPVCCSSWCGAVLVGMLACPSYLSAIVHCIVGGSIVSLAHKSTMYKFKLSLTTCHAHSLSTIHTSHFLGHLTPFLISVLISLMSHSGNNEEKIQLLHKREVHLLAQLQKVHTRIKECLDSMLAHPDTHLKK